jgi:membrane-bound lytic murein transglycosylase B
MSISWRFAQIILTSSMLVACSTRSDSASGGAGATKTQPAHVTVQPEAGSSQGPNRSDLVPEAKATGQGRGFKRSEIERFGHDLAVSRKLNEAQVQKLLTEARYNPTVYRLLAPPTPSQKAPTRSWQTYRSRVVEPVRIAQGRQFMQEYESALKRASQRYNVPKEIIAAIIGVETGYGRNQGNFSVLDALTTLAFDYPDTTRPDRIEMFRNQLADLIELHQVGKVNARTLKGSFAGAVGIPQFMPTSIKLFAVSAQGRDNVDLSQNIDDAIFSVANFLVAHGWQPGLPVFAPVKLPANPAKLVDGGLKPTLDWTQLQAAGSSVSGAPIQANPSIPPATDKTRSWMHTALGVIDLPEQAAGTTEFRVATPNFFTITQYNRSYFYAASVADLAAALTKRN